MRWKRLLQNRNVWVLVWCQRHRTTVHPIHPMMCSFLLQLRQKIPRSSGRCRQTRHLSLINHFLCLCVSEYRSKDDFLIPRQVYCYDERSRQNQNKQKQTGITPFFMFPANQQDIPPLSPQRNNVLIITYHSYFDVEGHGRGRFSE